MTAIVIAAQPNQNRIFVATDAASYDERGDVVSFGEKVFTIANWPGLVVSCGNAMVSPWLGWWLSQNFATLDDFVDRGEAALPTVLRDVNFPCGALVIVAGISSKRGAEAYSFSLDDTVANTMSREQMEASDYFAPPLKMVKLGDLVVTPVPNGDEIIAANFEGIDPDGDEAATVWSLRKVLAMQRHMALPERIGGIGGFAALTTITPDSITRRIVERWPEDKVGAPLRPAPIDWDHWHDANPKPGVSRLRRDVEARKVRKRLHLVGS